MVTPSARNAALLALFQAGLAGDEARYAQFLQALTPILRRMVARKIPTSDVEDVVQEILISIHKARHTYDGNRPLMPWLAAIAQFRMTDHLRRIYATSRRETVDVDALADVLADVTEPTSGYESMDSLLSGASTREREILTMMHVEGFTAKEAGAQLGMNESAVKVAAHRALKKLRKQLTGT